MRIAARFPVTKLARLVARYRYHEDQRDAQRQRIARDWIQATRDLKARNGLTARQCRYARMGNQLARYRYAAPGDWWLRTRALYSALLANPPALFDVRFPKRELLPGREPLWRLLSRWKRSLGFRPRERSGRC